MSKKESNYMATKLRKYCDYIPQELPKKRNNLQQTWQETDLLLTALGNGLICIEKTAHNLSIAITIHIPDLICVTKTLKRVLRVASSKKIKIFQRHLKEPFTHPKLN